MNTFEEELKHYESWERSRLWALRSTYWVQYGSIPVGITGFLLSWQLALIGGFIIGCAFMAYFWAHTARGWIQLLGRQVSQTHALTRILDERG